MLKLKHWSRPASIAFSLLFIAIMCFTLLPSPVKIGPLSFGGAGVASADGEGWLTGGYEYRTPIPVNANGTVAGTVHAGIGSRCVLGTGTSFLTWARYDHIQLPDGDWYQIDYISSDTELWLSLPYRGSSTGNHRLIGIDVSDFRMEETGVSASYFTTEKFTCAEAGTVDTIRVKSLATGNGKFSIYNDGDGALGAGQPGTRRCYDNTGRAITTGQWNTITPSWTGTTTLVAGTVYWLGYVVDTNAAIIQTSHFVGNPSNRRYVGATYSTFAAPADANGYGAFTSDVRSSIIAAWDFDTGSSSYNMRRVNYQLKITVYKGSGSDSAGVIYCGGNCLDDFTDIRFTSSDGETIIPYYKFTYSSGTSAEFWVKLPTVTGAADTFYIYYSNASPVAPSLPPIGYFPNAAAATIDNAAHDVTVENMVYDSVTNKYWWAWAKVNAGGKYQIWLSSSSTISADPAAWTNEAAALLADGSYHYMMPHLVKFGSTWYLYYAKGASSATDTYVQTSTTVNSGYGTETLVLAKGAAGTWDAARAVEVFVFYDGSQYRMLYMGESDDGYLYEQIGMASCATPDGTFTKSSLNPIIRGNWFAAAWDSGRDKAADPWAVKDGDTWYIGTAASNYGKWISDGASSSTGIVTTTDWELFCESGNSFPAIYAGKSGNFDSPATWRGAMVVDGNGDSLDASKWWLAYGAANTAGAWKGGLTSIDRTRTTHDFYPSQVFDFYDGFDGVTLNESVWYIEAGTPAVGSGLLTLTGTDYETVCIKIWPLFSKFLAYGKLDYVGASYAGNIGLATGVWGTGSPRVNFWIESDNDLHTVTNTTSTGRGTSYENTNLTWQILWTRSQVVFFAGATSWTQVLTIPNTTMPVKLATVSGAGSVVIDWVALAKVSNPEPAWNTPGGQESGTPDISNTPSSKDFGIVQPSQTYWAGAGEGEKTLSQLLNDDSATLYTGFSTKAGGRFNSWPVSTISSMSIYLDKLGSPTGTLYVKVRKVSDNSEVGTLGSKDVATLTTDATWYTFNTPVEVSTAQDIRIMAEYDGGDESNLVHSRAYSDIYAGGNFTYYIEGSGYYTSSTDDFTWGNLTYTSAEPPFPLETSDCWGNLTNNSSFAVNILASMTDMTGGTTWSIGSSPGTNVFTLKIGIAGTANIGNFTTLSNTPVAWITSMAAGNMTRWTMVFYTPTNSPQFADGTPKSGNMTFEAEAS